jgi:TetR/AcrR family hemagglutinin/protease transcriptional regulator
MDTLTKQKRTRLSPQKRKTQLLDLAIEVFAEKGIGRGGHADIAELSQVSVATVFNYFPTREDLVDDVLQRVITKFEQFVVSTIDSEAHAKQNLQDLTEGVVNLVLTKQHWIKVWFEWSASTRSEVWPLFVTSNALVTKHIQIMFEQAIERGEICDQHETEHLAKMLYGILYTVFTQASREPDIDALESLTNSVLNMLCIYKHAEEELG